MQTVLLGGQHVNQDILKITRHSDINHKKQGKILHVYLHASALHHTLGHHAVHGGLHAPVGRHATTLVAAHGGQHALHAGHRGHGALRHHTLAPNLEVNRKRLVFITKSLLNVLKKNQFLVSFSI